MTEELLNQSVGQVNQIADDDKLLGTTGLVEDSEFNSTSQLRKKNSGMLIRARVVKFTAVLAPGTRVKFTSGYAGTRVEQAGAEPAAGIVDPFLAASTAADDIGLIFTEGPMDVVSSAAFAANESLQGAASGKIGAEVGGVTEGIAIEAATGADENVRAYMKFPEFGQESGLSDLQVKTADYTVLTTESGDTFSTAGAAAAVVFTLPAATVGLKYRFHVGAAQELRLDPDGTETISLPSTGVPGAAGKYLTANAAGESVDIECALAGTWTVFGYTGTWTAEA